MRAIVACVCGENPSGEARKIEARNLSIFISTWFMMIKTLKFIKVGE